MNAVSQWWIGGLRTRKAKVAGSISAIIPYSRERLANRFTGYQLVTAKISESKSISNYLGSIYVLEPLKIM